MSTTGKLVQNSVVCEQFMYMAFAIISKTTHDVARAIFYSFDSFAAKRNLLKRIMDTGIDEIDAQLVNKIMKAVEKANNQRNELSHAAFLFEDEANRASFLLYRPKHGESFTVTVDALSNWRSHSQNACVEASQAFQQLSEKHQRPLTIALK